MLEILTWVGVPIGILTGGILLYDRFFRKKHRINIEPGNVIYAKVFSNSEERKGKLAFAMYDLKVINSGIRPFTVKDIVLRYYDENKEYESRLYSIRTSSIGGNQFIANVHISKILMIDQAGGQQKVVIENCKENIYIAWENIWKKIVTRRVLQPGEMLDGSALFILDIDVDNADKIKNVSLLVKDYEGNVSEHPHQAKEDWTNLIHKMRSYNLIDGEFKVEQTKTPIV